MHPRHHSMSDGRFDNAAERPAVAGSSVHSSEQVPAEAVIHPVGPSVSAAAIPELMTACEVADLFQVTQRTLRNWRARGLLTPIRLTARTIFYRRKDVLFILGESA